ncbi:hypothetical protein PULV_a2011 [Pseudoalteromonas ulvae UL12]|uniref:Response regulatory domain-containing protein n=1 Tax=Pseudoalteromonas ulvae TaxID=107327 RepID=A0A244CQM0_PSEDV|nr:response regulator [Pseudoalteromonas ulvae]MBE0365248.1 hypothetical protein [Pseudoalteromonas ulvae UL12]OUL57786.1 hypothetical protein B1199_12080 [Pseudoalteromonas ulvae]
MKEKVPCNVVIVTKEPDEIKLIIGILNKSFERVLVVSSVAGLTEQLKEEAAKVFLISTEIFADTLSIYYQALEKADNNFMCEHAVVALIARQQEQDAFEAFQRGVIDDYLVARPLYELHRPVVICHHLLQKMGLSLKSLDFEEFIIKNDSFSDAAKMIISSGLERKTKLKDAFHDSLLKIELSLDNAAKKVAENKKAHLNLEELEQTLSAIRSDSIRPELLRLQSKALHLLQQIITEEAEEQADEEREVAAALESDATATKSGKVESFNRLHNTGVKNVNIPEADTKVYPKLLIVEDDAISLNITLMIFQQYKLEVTTATSGRSALNELMKKKFDLILMDIFLPDTNGIYLLNQVCHNTGVNQTTPVIMLSGNKNKATVQKAVSMGAKGYIIKPLCKNIAIKLFEKYQLPLYRKK